MCSSDLASQAFDEVSDQRALAHAGFSGDGHQAAAPGVRRAEGLQQDLPFGLPPDHRPRRGRAHQRLYLEKFREAMTRWLDDLKRRAYIQIPDSA